MCILILFQVYSDDNRSPFPDELAELCDVIANYLGYSCFKAEAAIVNYYHRDSTLSPHTDHSEVNLDAPLFSFRLVLSILMILLRPVKIAIGINYLFF